GVQTCHYRGEGKAYDPRVGADELHHEPSGDALDGVGSGLPLPFAARDIVADLGVREIAEADAGLDHALAFPVVGRDQADGAIDSVAAAAQALESLGRSVALFGLADNAPPHGARAVRGKALRPA